MKPIYLDYNATTPIAPEVAAAMQPYLTEHFGNPSSSHWYGRQAKQAVERARGQIARLLGCETDEIIFTSGGSESNNMALIGAMRANRERGNHIICSTIEHPAVINVCRYLEREGMQVTYLPVDKYGVVNPLDVSAAITLATVLISIMHANNEVGTIQPISEISRIAHQNGIIFHTDAAQSVGKIPTFVNELGVDLLSIAGHKLYAPKGVGALYIRKGIHLEKLIHGADHEKNRRAGTENVLEIVGLGQAAELALGQLSSSLGKQHQLRDRLQQGLAGLGHPVRINGHPQQRLPNTLSISFEGLRAGDILQTIGDRVAASAGAACHGDSATISGVLLAMQVPAEFAPGTIRFSVGKMTTEAEIEQVIAIIQEALLALKSD